MMIMAMMPKGMIKTGTTSKDTISMDMTGKVLILPDITEPAKMLRVNIIGILTCIAKKMDSVIQSGILWH